jgi:hypothetical protein
MWFFISCRVLNNMIGQRNIQPFDLAFLSSVITRIISLAVKPGFAHRQGQLVGSTVESIENLLWLLGTELLRIHQKVASFIDSHLSLLYCLCRGVFLSIRMGWILSNMIVCLTFILKYYDWWICSELE